jgi:hypothetical protein
MQEVFLISRAFIVLQDSKTALRVFIYNVKVYMICMLPSKLISVQCLEALLPEKRKISHCPPQSCRGHSLQTDCMQQRNCVCISSGAEIQSDRQEQRRKLNQESRGNVCGRHGLVARDRQKKIQSAKLKALQLPQMAASLFRTVVTLLKPKGKTFICKYL